MSNEAPKSKKGERSTAQGSSKVSTIGFWVGGAQSFSDAGPAGSPPDASEAAPAPTNADWLQWFESATTLRPEDRPVIERSVVSCYFWEKDTGHREEEEIDRSKFTAEQHAILESVDQTHQHYDTALTAGERYRDLDTILKDKEFCFSLAKKPILRLEAARECVTSLSGLHDAARRARDMARSAAPSPQSEENSLKYVLRDYLISIKGKPYHHKCVTRLVRAQFALLAEEGSKPAAQQD